MSFNFDAKLRKNRHRIIILLILFEYFNRFVPKIARFFYIWVALYTRKQVKLMCSERLFRKLFLDLYQ